MLFVLSYAALTLGQESSEELDETRRISGRHRWQKYMASISDNGANPETYVPTPLPTTYAPTSSPTDNPEGPTCFVRGERVPCPDEKVAPGASPEMFTAMRAFEGTSTPLLGASSPPCNGCRVQETMAEIEAQAAVGVKDYTHSEHASLKKQMYSVRFYCWNYNTYKFSGNQNRHFGAEVINPLSHHGAKAKALAPDAERTIVYIHGFISDAGAIKNTIMGHRRDGNYNFVALDWREIAKFQHEWLHGLDGYIYPQHATGKVGIHAAHMLKALLEANNIDLDTVIVEGHSLGAHVAGVMCRYYRAMTGQEIRMMIGLDPAAPGYACDSSHNSCSWRDRNRADRFVPWAMRKTDASYVQAVHTDGGLKAPYVIASHLGDANKMGDSDWYINGGQHQPWCWVLPCSHLLAPIIIGNAAKDPHGFIGKPCGPTARDCSEEKLTSHAHVFLNEEYGSPSSAVVNSGTKPYGAFYVKTTHHAPYTLKHW